MKRIWQSAVGRASAAWGLAFVAVAAVASALAGADASLEGMKYHAAIGALAVLAGWVLCATLRSLRNPGAFLFHLGFALVLGGWVYNAWCGPEDGSLRLRRGQRGRVADVGELELAEFRIDRWPDTGTVRQYSSRAWATNYGEATGAGPSAPEVEITVNHPHVLRSGPLDPGWWIYQNSYQELENPHTGAPLYFTILLCVRDVGLYWSALGALLLILGAVAFMVRIWPRAAAVAPPKVPRAVVALYVLAFAATFAMLVHRAIATGHPPMQNMYEFLMCTACLLPALTGLSRRLDGRDTLLLDAALQALVLVPVAFFMNGEVKHLMPALQSPFFVPHVGAYVLGYVLLVRAALGAGTRWVGVGFLLLTVGLVLGAAWGKVCWGHWWQFDPKEMWSLATWCTYLAYFHVRGRLTARGERIFLAVGAAMIVLTLTWINLSRIFAGMHSYA